jgi:membrane fusion protein (multidrug efflux system)
MSPRKDSTDRRPNTTANQTESLQHSSNKSGRRARNLKIIIPLLLLIGGMVCAFWLYLINKRDFVSTDDAIIDGNRLSVSAKSLGRISQLMVDEGDSVHAGQALVKLDDSDLRAQEAQARASLALAQENIALAKVNMERAEGDYERAAAQFRDHVISKEQFDHTQSEYEAAKARTRIAAAQAQTAAAQLGIVETQLNNTLIVSPMDGVVSKRWVMRGDVVQAGQAILSIYDLKNVWITANLEETRLSALHEGYTVAIKVDAYPRQEFTGKVMQIGSNTTAQFSLIPPNNAAGNFTKITQRVPIKISIDRTYGSESHPIRLLPGMSVNIKVKVR